MKNIIALAASVLLMIAPSFAAAPFNADAVKRFAQTLDPVQKFGDALEKEGKLNALVGAGAAIDGDFRPYSSGVISLKEKFPADLARFALVLKPFGFTPEEWALTGDRVMAAYMALRIERDQPGALAELEEMDRAEIDKMPPEMRAQMLDYIAMMKAVKNAPASDKDIVLPSMDAIDAHIAAQEASGAPK